MRGCGREPPKHGADEEGGKRRRRRRNGIDRYGSAANTPPASPLERTLGRVLTPLAWAALKLYGALSKRPAGDS